MKSVADTNPDTVPPYGVVDRYLGEQGREYFQPQHEIGLRAGMWNKFIFEPYIGAEDDVLDFGCGGGVPAPYSKASDGRWD